MGVGSPNSSQDDSMSDPNASRRSTSPEPSAAPRAEASPAPAGDTSSTAPRQSDDVSRGAAPRARMSEGWPRRLLLNWVLPLGLLVLGAAAVWALGVVQPEQRPAADDSRTGRLKALAPVRVEPVRSLAETGQDLQLKVDGTVVPYREVKIATEVSGEILFKSDRCEAGSYVHKGELLMRIDPTDYELAVERLTREKEQAYEALREIDQEMVNAQRLIEVAQQNVQLQQREVDRLKKLPEGYASDTELDQAEQALLQAKQERVTHQNQLDLLEKRRASFEAAERLAISQLRAAEVDLERTEIKAPIDGVIVAEDAELNSFVSRGSPLVTMEDTSRVEIATRLRMDQLYWVLNQSGQQFGPPGASYDLPETPAMIEYELSGRQGVAGRNSTVYRWQGRLIGYDGIGVDPDSRTVPVRVVVDQPRRYQIGDEVEQTKTGPPALVRGMYVTVVLKIDPAVPLVVLPARALKPGNRVWQFVPDESVLEVSRRPSDTVSGDGERSGDDGPASGSNDDEPASGSGDGSRDAGPFKELEPSSSENDSITAAVEKELERPFRPEAWVPGRVVVREGILPVDSLSLSGHPGPPSEPAESPWSADEGRMWVCEVSDGTLAGGSLVVVSPLSSTSQSRAAAASGGAPQQGDRGVLARAPAETVRAARAAAHAANPAAPSSAQAPQASPPRRPRQPFASAIPLRSEAARFDDARLKPSAVVPEPGP